MPATQFSSWRETETGATADASEKRLAAFFVVAAVVVFALDLGLLDQIPYAATVDDGAYASAAFRFIHTGRAGLALGGGMFGVDRDLIMYGRIPAAVVGLSQLALGPTSFASRLPSLLAVCLSVALVFAIARQCGLSPPLSLSAGLLWFLSAPARMLAHSARPDPFLPLFTLTASLLLIRALRLNTPAAFLFVGLVSGFSLEAHMVGSVLILSLAGAALMFSEPRRRVGNAFLVCFGAAPAALLWLYVHRFSQPDLWQLQWVGLWAKFMPPPLCRGPAAILASASLRYRAYFWDARLHRYAFEGLFLLVAVALGLARKAPWRKLAVLIVLFHGLLAVISSPPHEGYMAAVYPLACILITALFLGSSRRAFRWAGLSLAAFYLAQTAYWVAHRDPPLPASLRPDVFQVVDGQRFLATDNLWFYFSADSNARSAVFVNFMPFYAPDLSWPAAFEKYLGQEDIRFLVVDRVLENFLRPDQWRFFAERTALVRQYSYGRAGSVRIYEFVKPGTHTK